ncbi:adenosine deaminase [Naviculisporaceae sp. PSN 640]
MCKSPLHPFLLQLPKVEQHLHLEGSLSPELLFHLAQKNSISLPSPSLDPAFTSPATLLARYEKFTSLDDFLHYYYIGFTVLITVSDFEELSYAYLSRAAREANVKHAEVFFDPQVHVARGVEIETIVTGWERALRRLKDEEGVDITASLIPCFLRHLDLEDSDRCLGLLLDGDGKGRQEPRLVGIGLCSTEVAKPPSTWKSIFDIAREKGIRRTAHAGEEGPAEYVIAALDDLQVERIDHGVHAADDEKVMERLAREKILLTVCPVSNVQLKVKEKLEDVPLRVFLDKGVRFSLNSDDPAYFGAYLQEVYCRVQEAFGFTVREWEVIAKNGIEGSWCDEGRKKAVLKEIDDVVGAWVRREKEGESELVN